MNSPNRIYNVDETGICLDGHAPRVVALKGQKKVRYRTSGNKNQVTVIACVSASGQCIPPFVISDAKRLNQDWRKGEVAGTSYGLSDNGWVDTELFKGWLVEHFNENAVGSRPILLLMDGHSSHFQPEIIEFARTYKIIMFCLPPHTTHESQPLDTSVFKSLKLNWKTTCHTFTQSHPNQTITKYQFSSLLNEAWSKTMTTSTICAGFRKCGVYPFNPKAIDCGVSVANSQSSDKENQQSDKGQQSAEIANAGNHAESQQCSITNEERSDKQWSAEKIALFQRRFEEGYDLPDAEYLQWLHETHPPDEENTSLLAYFSDVAIATPIAESPMEVLETENEISRSTNPQSDTVPLEKEDDTVPLEKEGDTVLLEKEGDTVPLEEEGDTVPLEKEGDTQHSIVLSDGGIGGTSVSLEHSATLSNKEASTSVEANQKNLSSDVCSKAVESGSQLRYISKYLVQFVPDSRPEKKEQTVRISGARVLTSDKCAAILKEREEKKQKEKEEKEQRKLLREQKKREKEEELKRKKAAAAEKKAAAAEKRAAAAEKKIAASKKKAEVAEKRAATVTRKRSVAAESVEIPCESNEPQVTLESNEAQVTFESSEAQVTRKRSSSSYTLRKKRTRCDELDSSDVLDSGGPSCSSTVTTEGNTNMWQCSICYEVYNEEDTEDWVQCGCGRWTHELCITDIVIDVTGKELFCPYCSV